MPKDNHSKAVVLHLEMPRGLSLTIKPWRQDLFRALENQHVEFKQIDLNPNFWRFYLDDPSTGFFEQLINISYQSADFNSHAIDQAAKYLRRYNCDELSAEFSGFELNACITQSIESIESWVTSDSATQWIFPWIASFSEDLANANIVSFSVGSPDELAVAAAIAEYLRQYAPEKHCVLTYHRWENFSLAPKLDMLISQGKLLQLFDSVVLKEEKAGESLAGLSAALSTGDLSQLRYIGTMIDDQPALVGHKILPENITLPSARPSANEDAAISAYLKHLALDPNRILMLETFVRNDCHYARCTFCVQNDGYPSHQQFKHEPELERALTLVKHLSEQHGVRSYSFIDQALPSALARKIAERMTASNINIKWCCRMLPEHADMDSVSLQSMATAGCREILIGLESINKETLQSMGKADKFEEHSAHAWIERCGQANIDVTLSAIKNFPTESSIHFANTTGRFLQKCADRYQNVNIILNTFNLFSNSQMARKAENYNIVELDRSDNNLAWVLNYRDGFGRCFPDDPEGGDQFKLKHATDSPNLLYLHYSSFGLLHRWQTGRWLYEHVDNTASTNSENRFMGRDEIILGSEGYLGSNIARVADSKNLILASRRLYNDNTTDAPYISEDLTKSNNKLMQLQPKTAWICSRPFCDEFSTQARFNYHIEVLLNHWASKGHLQRVIFFSTQLVSSTPENGQLASGQSALEPEQAYDYGKAQLEIFCGYLSRKYDVNVDVIRLPLLWGGYSTQEHRDQQLLHYWQNRLQQGDYWDIPPEENDYGNSWVDVDDLILRLLKLDDKGLQIRSVKSGDFYSADLVTHWRNTEASNNSYPLDLVKSQFFMKDELGIDQRNLFSYEFL